MAGPGLFTREADCTLKSNGGMGLLWHSEPLEGDYSLQLDWKLTKDDNGGVFVGFPDPGNDPWIAVNQGYEIQIDATDVPDRTTGAIYTFQGANSARDAALNPVNEWNHYEIRVEGKRIRDLPQRRAGQRLHQHRRQPADVAVATSGCRTTAAARTSSTATCRSWTSPTRRTSRPT